MNSLIYMYMAMKQQEEQERVIRGTCRLEVLRCTWEAGGGDAQKRQSSMAECAKLECTKAPTCDGPG